MHSNLKFKKITKYSLKASKLRTFNKASSLIKRFNLLHQSTIKINKEIISNLPKKEVIINKFNEEYILIFAKHSLVKNNIFLKYYRN